MKKIVLIIVAICMIFTTPQQVQAKTYTYDTYQELGVYTAMIVGDYVFNLDEGYSPSLQDIMIATRTIPEDKDVYLYFVISFGSSFTFMNLYTGEVTNNPEEFKVFTAKYLYSDNIKTATKEDYKEI